MVFSKATGYGIRALAYMAAKHDPKLCGLNEIARSQKIPPVYLRKLLGELRRHRMVDSVKGIHGGYLLARNPASITLWEVFQVLDHHPYLDECSLCGSRDEGEHCSFCNQWKKIREELLFILKHQTIADFASRKPRTAETPDGIAQGVLLAGTEQRRSEFKGKLR